MLLIRNIHTLFSGGKSPEEIHGVNLLIDGQTIEGIYRNLPEGVAADIEEIDGSSMVILPGFINLHHHFTQILTRNLPGAQQAKLFDWLVYLYPIWSRITGEMITSATSIAAAELLLSGCTTSVDHFYCYPYGHNEFFDIEIEAVRQTGLRLAICRGSMSLSKKDGGLPPDEVTQSVDVIMRHSEDVIDRYHSSLPGAMVQVILAPCSPFSVSRELMFESKRLARDRGVLTHTHLAETQDEEEFCRSMFGCSPLDYLDKLGWLDEQTFLAHMVWLTDNDIDRISRAGTGIAHCPTSNMRLGSGIARVVPLLRKGVPVGIAVDGTASNDSSNMLNEIRQTMLLQRVRYGADSLSARDVLTMATAGGSAVLHRPDLGVIEKGACADVVGIRIDRLPFAGGLADPLAATVFGLAERVDLTIVAGKTIVRDQQLVDVDLTQLIERHNRLARTLLG